MRKGITPIIAIIVLLLITVALAGTAYTYLMGYMGGLTGKSVEVKDSFCVAGNRPTIALINTGTLPLPVNDISIIDTVTGNQPAGIWAYANGTVMPGNGKIPSNGFAKWNSTNIDCTSGCMFRVLAGTAKAQIAPVQC